MWIWLLSVGGASDTAPETNTEHDQEVVEQEPDPDPAQVQRLAAWARVYGYFRWFHPSDELSAVDQEHLACLGAERALATANTDELVQALRGLYGPLAPSAAIWADGEDPPATAPIPQQEGLTWTAWMHRGVGLASVGLYGSARVDRPREVPGWGDPFGNVTTSVEAAWGSVPLRYSAKVRAVSGQAQLWFRTDGGETRFFDNMQDRPIRSDRWATYTIEGTVPEGTKRLVFGVFAPAVGEIELDELSLEVQVDGTWTSVELPNPGFENGTKGYQTDSKGYLYDTVDGPSGQALRVRRQMVRSSALFERMPERDAATRTALGAGVRVDIPLVVPFDAAHTLPVGDLPAVQPALDAVSCDEPTQVQTRLAAVAIAWNVHQHFHPYLDVVDADWGQALPEALEGALRAESPYAFREVLERMTARLEDGHVSVSGGTGRLGRLPLRLAWIEDQVVVVQSGLDGVGVGDVLLALDGVAATELRAGHLELVSGSPQYTARRATNALLTGPRNAEVSLTIQSATGAPRTVVSSYDGSGWSPEPAHPAIRTLDDGVMVVDLTQVEWDELKGALKDLSKAPGVVVDLRGYPTGAGSKFLPHVIEKRTGADWMFIAEQTHPDQAGPTVWTGHTWKLKPKRPHVGNTVWITDGSAISYAESVMGHVRDLGVGPIVGEATAGANGNVNPYALPGGYRLSWTGMKVLNRDGSQHHVLGVRPTHPMAPTLEGVRAGRDELLEAALDLLK